MNNLPGRLCVMLVILMTMQTKSRDLPYTILCYGDSNTHGTRPDTRDRYDVYTRWTRVLQDMLGAKFYVIEEGLGGRTVDLEHQNAQKPSRNGWNYFRVALDSHQPDAVVVMLGTNDTKRAYGRDASAISASLEKYIVAARDSGASAVYIVAPVAENADRLLIATHGLSESGDFDITSVRTSEALPEAYHELARRMGVEFLDANQYCKTGEDGLHWTPESHQSFAKQLAAVFANRGA